MQYSVRVKPNHPTGMRRRGGFVFTKTPVTLGHKDMTDEIKSDPWLIVTEAKGDEKKDETKEASAEQDEGGGVKEGKKSLLDKMMGK